MTTSFEQSKLRIEYIKISKVPEYPFKGEYATMQKIPIEKLNIQSS
jgi:hypothetical protein